MMMNCIQKSAFYDSYKKRPSPPSDKNNKEFVFIGHIDDITGNTSSYSVLFGRQHLQQ